MSRTDASFDNGRLNNGRFPHGSPNLKHDFFSRDAPQTDWLAGLIAADGCLISAGRRWTLAQSGDHGSELIRRVAEMIGYGLPLHASKKMRGADSHWISVTSERMVKDLAERYMLTPRKSLTLRWPGLNGPRAAAFLRGYVDGDGTVNTYAVGAVKAMLHVSLVGTSEFVAGASSVTPAPGRQFVQTRAQNMVDLRWSGRYAWATGNWIYQHRDELPISAKASRFNDYRALFEIEPPAWATVEVRRAHVLALLRQGVPPMRVAEQTGEHFQTVYSWRKAA